ncbi:hypothetical protein K3495_g2274 [Podosphaera aphanis]|nr:hypothetical protein K3495_g2274 [Podosphaera aphanis]
MFLSYGGTRIPKEILVKEMPRMAEQVEEAYHEIHELNVHHEDTKSRNILCHSANRQVVVIDFERLKIYDLLHKKERKGSKMSKLEVEMARKFKNEPSSVKFELSNLLKDSGIHKESPQIAL